MNALLKKEIRLLLPSWGVAMLLAMVQAAVSPYDFYDAWLVLFGLVSLALSTIGREASLNTFASLLAQPADRVRLWQMKLSVLAGAFLTVLLVWLAAFAFSCGRFRGEDFDRASAYHLFIAICFIASTTFTGGLWTTLLLRQMAGAFWLTLLVPVTLFSLASVFFVNSETDYLAIAILSVVNGVYSLAGFLFARRLFFRAQDVGWSGGSIVLPEWKLFRGSAAVRRRRPWFALLKKEWLLQQGILGGAVALFFLHASMIALRILHPFPKDSAGDVLTSVVWLLWVVLPVLLGCLSVAEERKLGIIESQLCLPVSRRFQFAVKAAMVLGWGILLGGVMPLLLEGIGLALGSQNPMFMTNHQIKSDPILFLFWLLALSAGLALVSLFASSLAKQFLEAVGIALLTLVVFGLCAQAFTNQGMVFYDSIAPHAILYLLVGVPTLAVALLWLAYLNYHNLRAGWRLARRIALGAVGTVAFTIIGQAAIYHRAWEIFLPTEPSHGPAKLLSANPPLLCADPSWNEFHVQLPNGRIWFDRVGYGNRHGFRSIIHRYLNPFPVSIGLQGFITGSNWVSLTIRDMDISNDQRGHRETVGVKADGTLWISGNSDFEGWDGKQLTQFGDESNWLAASRSDNDPSILLLKKDGTLWRWGTHLWSPTNSPLLYPALRELTPYRIGTDSDWKDIAPNKFLAQKADGSTWKVQNHWREWDGYSKDPSDTLIKYGDRIRRDTNFDQVDFSRGRSQNLSEGHILKNGTLWLREPAKGYFVSQVGKETDWDSFAPLGQASVALKTDGTLWQLNGYHHIPIRLGIHQDWVALTSIGAGVVTLAADGSLWLWPVRDTYSYDETLLQLPKQPQYLGNVYALAKN